MEIKRIAINTGGGDAPGLNAVIRAAVLSALNRGWECYGIRDGYNGLMVPGEYPDGGLMRLKRETVRGITHRGGTILGTTNRGNPLKYPTRAGGGQMVEQDRSDEILAAFRRHGLDALIAIGGDGSLSIASPHLLTASPERPSDPRRVHRETRHLVPAGSRLSRGTSAGWGAPGARRSRARGRPGPWHAACSTTIDIQQLMAFPAPPSSPGRRFRAPPWGGRRERKRWKGHRIHETRPKF